jgi:hypothetical protein
MEVVSIVFVSEKDFGALPIDTTIGCEFFPFTRTMIPLTIKFIPRDPHLQQKVLGAELA